MIRTRISLLAIVFFLAVTGFAHAQIKVVKKPAPKVGPDEEVIYTWSSSWGLRDDLADKYPHGIGTHKTEAEAVAAAKAHIAKTAQNGYLAVTHYLIEGEPSVRSTKAAEPIDTAKDLLTRLKEAKDAVDRAIKIEKGDEPLLKARERKLGDTVKEYVERVKGSFRQATEAKKTLTGGVAGLTEAKMREVNGLIDKYNREVQDFNGVMGNSANLGYSPLARVEPPPAEKEPASIIGTWKGVSILGEEKLGVTTEFHEDGTLTMTFDNGRSGKLKWTQEGNTILVGKEKWQLKGNQISGSYTSSRGLPGSFSYTKQ